MSFWINCLQPHIDAFFVLLPTKGATTLYTTTPECGERCSGTPISADLARATARDVVLPSPPGEGQGTRKGMPLLYTKRLAKPVYSRAGLAPALEDRPHFLKCAPMGLAPALEHRHVNMYHLARHFRNNLFIGYIALDCRLTDEEEDDCDKQRKHGDTTNPGHP